MQYFLNMSINHWPSIEAPTTTPSTTPEPTVEPRDDGKSRQFRPKSCKADNEFSQRMKDYLLLGIIIVREYLYSRLRRSWAANKQINI